MITVDTPVPGRRERDPRNGFTFANVSTGDHQDPAGVMAFFAAQLRTTLQLCGVASIGELRERGPQLVRPQTT